MAPANGKVKGTPGRPKKKGNQFWDIGKVGRKTGITLEDKGIRDEHGLEPVEHIFSSPVDEVNGARESSDGLMQESSGPEVGVTLTSRRTPRLPPPRASTPRHTNIGSPKRMSTGRGTAQRTGLSHDSSPNRPRTQPPTNRVLDFGAEKVHRSIEKASPFRPRHALRRSTIPHSASPGETDESNDAAVEVAEEIAHSFHDDAPLMLDNDVSYEALPPPERSVDIEEQQPQETASSPSRARAQRTRKSDGLADSSGVVVTPDVSRMSIGKKRDRSLLEEDQAVEVEQNVSHSELQESARSQKKQRGRPTKENHVVIHHRNGEDETIDPALLAYGDSYEVDTSLEAALTQPPKNKGKGKGKAKKAQILTPKDANRAVRTTGSPGKAKDSRERSRGASAGPMNIYHLRATTPFEDAGEKVSRFGRNLIQPLKFWANEARIYKHGEIEGIVRAESVEKPKARRPKKRNKKRNNKLDDIEEESESESVVPDEWEEDVGVIGGMVANWDPETQAGVPEDLIREDLAFAASSIVTRDVPNSDFRYAKVMTLPFFGSGIVELPPGGRKRVKNSRKMQMCFFVHEGKVLVEIGAAGVNATPFAISKGGVWVVPRGNNYAIANESKTTSAKIFFAQGCEVDAAIAAAVAEEQQ